MLLGQFLINHLLRKISTPLSLKIKGVNAVLEVIPVWPAVRYISDIG